MIGGEVMVRNQKGRHLLLKCGGVLSHSALRAAIVTIY